MKKPWILSVCLLGCGIANAVGADSAVSEENRALVALNFLGTQAPPAVVPSAALIPHNIFSRLPVFLRSQLARHNRSWRTQEIAQLQKEVAELLPPGSFEKMALIPQSSHDYLLLSLPKVSSPEIEKEWIRRLGLAHAKLLQILALQTQDSALWAGEADTTRLALGLIECFSYGFEGAEDRALKKFLKEGQQHLQQVLNTVEASGSRAHWSVLLLKFLIGKHAVNVANESSHPGEYDRYGQAVAPEPEAAMARDLAFRYLGEVVRGTESSTKAGEPFSREFLVNLESRYHLAKLEAHHYPAYLGEAFLGSPGLRRKMITLQGSLRGVILDYLKVASPEWIQQDMPDAYGLLFRLINSLRWSIYDIDRAQADALYEIERALRSPTLPTYHKLIEDLVEAGLSELAPLLSRLQCEDLALPHE